MQDTKDGKVQIDFSKQWWIKHDMSTFSGRLRHFINVTDFRKSFTSTETLLKNEQTLKNAEVQGVGIFTKEEAEDLYNKKIIQLSCIHPDNGQVIPWPSRTSAFVATNLPIIGAMQLSAPTTFNTIFWQWFNQSYNAAFNYANRNATTETSYSLLFTSYAIAISSSITIAMTLRKLTGYFLAGKTSMIALLATPVVNYGAVTSSSAMNVYFMRGAELKSGISVLDPETKQEIGKSKIAANKAIWSSIYARWIYLIPIFFSNPVLEAIARKMKIMPKGGVLKFIADLTFCGMGLATAIPILCAVSE